MANRGRRIPYMRFEQNVKEEVLKALEPFELIHFASLSHKAKLLVMKTFKNKPTYLPTVVIEQEYSFKFQTYTGCWYYTLTDNVDKEYTIEPTGTISLRMFVYSDDHLGTFKELFIFIRDIFGVGYAGFILKLDTFPDRNRNIINFLKLIGSVFSFAQPTSDGEFNDGDLRYFIETVKYDKLLSVREKISDNFRVNLPKDVKQYMFWHGNFLKLEQILKLNTQKIWLSETSLTTQDLNALMTKWVAMKTNLDLKFFTLPIESQKALLTILNGIPYTVMENDEKVYYEIDEEEVRGGWQIKRNDGKTARVMTKLIAGEWFMSVYVD